MLRHILLILWLLSAAWCGAQSVPLTHFTVADGLPSNKIYQVYRDSKGFLWFGTDKGAVRYNGLQFEHFTTADGLPDNEIFSFIEDKEQRLWIGSFSGDLCYYHNNRFYTAANAPFLKLPARFPHVERITAEYDSSITILFTDRQEFINIRHQKIKVFYLKKIEAAGNLVDIIQIRKLSAYRYEVLYKSRRVQIDTAGNLCSVQPYKYNSIYSYSTTEQENYLLGEDGLYSIDEQLLRPIKKFRQVIGYTVAAADSHNFFLCSSNGLFINDSMHVLKGVQLTGICKDVTGNYWITSLSNGVYFLADRFVQTNVLAGHYTGKINNARQDGSSVFFSTEHNDYRIEHKAIKPLPPIPRDEKVLWKSNSTAAAYPDFLVDSFGLATVPPACIQLMQKAAVTNIYCKDSFMYGITHYMIKCIDYRIEPISGRYALKALFSPREAENRIFCWGRDSHQHLWFSTANAVYKIVQGALQEQRLFRNNPLRLFLFHNNYLIGYTHKNELMIYRENERQAALNTISAQDCVWDRFYVLDQEHVMISTDNLYRVLTLKNTGYNIQTIERASIPLQADYLFSDGENCYFFKNGSILSFKKELLTEPSPPPEILFTSMVAGDKNYAVRPKITLQYKDANNIHLTFKSLSFAGKYLTYLYSISNGGEDHWYEIKGDVLNIAAPGSGTYLIKIKARSRSSPYSAPATLQLTILRPYWTLWWFVLMIILIAGSLLWYAVRRIIRHKLGKRIVEHKREIKYRQSEFKALNALMNPHFIFNSLNNIRGLITRNDNQAAERYLLIFSKLVRQNMHNISQELISLQRELDLVLNYLKLEQPRFKNHISYTISISDKVETDDIMIPPLIIQPLVENAIRHGLLPRASPESKVIIRVYEADEVVHIEVEDNGVGLHHTANGEPLHESFGLSNLEQRIAHMRLMYRKEITFSIHELTDERGQPAGTIATIKIYPDDRL